MCEEKAREKPLLCPQCQEILSDDGTCPYCAMTGNHIPDVAQSAQVHPCEYESGDFGASQPPAAPVEPEFDPSEWEAILERREDALHSHSSAGSDIVNRLRFDAARCEVGFSKGVASNIEEAADTIVKLRTQASTDNEGAPRDWFSDLNDRVEKGLNAELEPSADADACSLPLQYEDGPDYCTVRDAQGRDFALTVQPKLMQAMERALLTSAQPQGARKP